MPRTQHKRNLSSSSSPKAVDKKSKIFISPNRYAALSEDSASTADVFSPPPVPDQTTIQNEVTVDHLSPSVPPSYEDLKSPPIFIKNVSNLNGLKSDLIAIVGSEGFTLRSSKDFLKITTLNCKCHMQILDYLKESDLSFHTFVPRHTIPIVAFIRYLHHSTSIEDIETSLTELGFSIRSVSNIINRSNRQPMSLFTIVLDNNDFNRNIFKLTKLLNFKIIIERLRTRKTRLHPQCKQCQSYGHTSRYCSHDPRCVKCGTLDHLTSDCSKPRDLPAKCALCLGAHTANFKGCLSFNQYKSSHKKSPPSSNTTYIRKTPPKAPSNEAKKLMLNLGPNVMPKPLFQITHY